MNKNTGYAALRAELKRAREKVDSLTQKLDECKSDETLYALVSANTYVKNRIISEYLLALCHKPELPLCGSNGFTAITPVNKPKNLADAKRLADKIIKY